MGDAAPSSSTLSQAPTTVHYLIADGCVHVYGEPVSTDAIVRIADVPLGADGVHVGFSFLGSPTQPDHHRQPPCCRADLGRRYTHAHLHPQPVVGPVIPPRAMA